MARFAIIETFTGYVWGVVDADDPVGACYAVDADVRADRGAGQYEPMSFADQRTTRGAYSVHAAPADFDVMDGQDRDAIEAVENLPRVGLFGWVGA